jgi:glutamyl/glutaminyl-tRNA synthetase
LITWWIARQAGAKIYMRMEDIDGGRTKPEAVAQAYADLRWLGMDWDAWEEKREVVQSERMSLYEEALERLWRAGAVYPCVCRRADIAASVAAGATAPHEGEGHPRYPGTCRDRFVVKENLMETVDAAFAATGKEPCFRLRVTEGV